MTASFKRDMTRERLLRARGRGLQHQALFDVCRAGDGLLERRVEFGQRDLGEEPEAAEVDAQDWNCRSGLANGVGHAEERAVAAEDDHQPHLACQHRLVGRRYGRARRHQLRRGVLEDSLDAPLAQPARNLSQVRRRRLQMRLGEDADTANGFRHCRTF